MANDKEIAIYYFSATGNSLKLSQDIASGLNGAELYRIGSTGNAEPSNAKMVGFVFPVYMGGLPDVVHKFLQNYPFKQGVYYFSIGTYYTYKGSAMSVVNKILSDNGVCLNYGSYLPSVGNCLKEYEVSPKKRLKILEQAEVHTANIIDDLKNRSERKSPRYYRLSDALHKGLFNAFFNETHRKFTLENSCVGCRICEKVCPVNNIVLKDGAPQWGANCEACHACVHWCPRNAINIGKSKGRLQYQNPGVRKSMLFNGK